MGPRVLAAVAAIAIGAALLAAAAEHAAGTDAGTGQGPARDEARSAAAARSPASAQDVAPGSLAVLTSPKRARVPAGVLVRAASRRAQEREAASPTGSERRRGREEGDVVSVEIDWHAGTSADR